MEERKLPVVVLIHGLIRTPRSMSFLGSRLGEAGYSILNFGYKSRKESIENHADKLHGVLKERFDTGTKISFVTHSLGSIVLRKFALKHGSGYDLERAVMLGPPNQGSGLARFLLDRTALGRILGPSFIEVANLMVDPATDKLEIGIIAGARGKRRGFPPYIRSDSDGIVSLEETKLPGMKDHLTVPFFHSLLMYHPGVIKQTIHFLKHGRFERPEIC